MKQPDRATKARALSAWLRVVGAFLLTAVASVGFALAYIMDAGTQWEGLALGVAFLGLATGLTIWARQLLPGGDFVEEHPAFASTPQERRLLYERIVDPAEVRPRRSLFALLGLSASTIGLGALLPVYSLTQPAGDRPAKLRRTAWRSGVRLVDPDGRPIRPEQVVVGTFLPVFPEGHGDDGDVPAFAVRLEPGPIPARPPGPDLDGLVVYSMLCTHAGCPVSLYQQGTGQVLCPCHQSLFDLRHGARRLSGPAARPLPGLPVAVDGEGYLYALGDFTSPPGAGYWSYP